MKNDIHTHQTNKQTHTHTMLCKLFVCLMVIFEKKKFSLNFFKNNFRVIQFTYFRHSVIYIKQKTNRTIQMIYAFSRIFFLKKSHLKNNNLHFFFFHITSMIIIIIDKQYNTSCTHHEEQNEKKINEIQIQLVIIIIIIIISPFTS